MEILIYILCAALGIAIGFLLGRNRKREHELEAQVKVFESQMADAEKHLSKSKEEWQAHTKELLDAQQAKFDETIAKVTAQMRSATDEMLKKRQEEFAASSNTSIGQIVNPLKETIDKMKEAMRENTIKQTEIGGEIKTQAINMMRQSEAAKNSADELTRVFRHAGRVQGNWGEIILDELLESQGLTKGVHYDIQSSICGAQ